MPTKLPLSLALCLLGAPAVHAQLNLPKAPPLKNNTLTNEVKTRLSKAKVNLDRSERNLKDVEELFARGEGKSGLNTPSELKRIEASLGKVEGWLKEVDEQLTPLPSVGEIAPYHDRLKAAQKLHADLRQRFDDSQKKSGDQNAALEAGIGKDKAAMKALTDLADQLKRLAPRDDAAKTATVLPFEKDAQRFVDTYGALKNAASADAVDVKRAVAFLGAMLREVRTEREKMVKAELPKDIQTLLGKLEEQGKAALKGNFAGYNDELFEYWLTQSVAHFRNLSPGIEGADIAFVDRAEARAKEIRAQVDAAAEKAIAQNRLRASTYTGGDVAALTQYLTQVWKETNPGEVVLTVRFWGVWQRRTSWDWSDFDRAWNKSDASTMVCAVVVKSPDGKYGYVHPVRVGKNHLKGDQLYVRIPPPGSRPANPYHIVPIAHL